jgi:hypothetical protein
MAAILRTCSGGICGTPSPELIEQLKDSPIQVYKPFQANPGNVNETHEHAGDFKEP